MNGNLLTRFYGMVLIEAKTNCHIWTGVRFRIDGSPLLLLDDKGAVNAIRWIYARFYGSPLTGRQIQQTCGNKLCVNPLHLRTKLAKEHTNSEGTVNG